MPKLKEIPYDSFAVRKIQQLYLAAIIFWTVLVIFLRIPHKADAITIVLISIPFIVFYINFQNAEGLTPSIERNLDQGVATFLSFGFMVIIILVDRNNNGKQFEESPYFRLIAAALILMVLSLLDVWPTGKNLSLVVQSRSAFRTMSLTLFILAFYQYYTMDRKMKKK